MTAAPERFEALDAWRGICALLVAMEHLNVANPLHANGLVVHGFRFVDFFFVLSGFVIAHAYRDRLATGAGEVKSFLIRRIGRLWPLHVTTLAILLGFQLVILVVQHAGISLGITPFASPNEPYAIPAHLLLVQGLGLFDHLTWNGPSWSISTEVFAYVTFAVLASLLAKHLQIVAGLVLAGSVVVLLAVAPRVMGSTYDFGVFRCLYGFMTGVLVRELHGRVASRVGTIGEIATVAIVVASVVWLPAGALSVLVTPVFAIAVWVFAAEGGALSRALRKPIPQRLGAWSYSIYMVHILVAVAVLTLAMIATKHGHAMLARVDGVSAIVGPTWQTTLVIAGYLGTVVGLSALTYRWIERPGQRLFARWAKR